MLARTFDALCLRTLGSSTLGYAVRTVIVLTSTEAAPCSKAIDGGANTMVPIR